MEFCVECGSQLIHAEGCVLCPACGWSMCNCCACNGKEEFSDVQSKDRAKTDKEVVSA